MTADKRIASYAIADAVEVILTECTRHYFGGYYHVRIVVHADVPLSSRNFESVPEYEDAVRRLGASAQFSRTLEKMAVPENMIEFERMALVASFDSNVLPYLLRKDFIGSFVRSEYRKSLKSVAPKSR